MLTPVLSWRLKLLRPDLSLCKNIHNLWTLDYDLKTYSGPRCSRHDLAAPLSSEPRTRLAEMGRRVIGLDYHQINEFAGNPIELSAGNDRILAISARPAASLTKQQKEDIEESARIVELSVPTIELAGGSIRCMLAGIHLARRC